MFLNIKQSAALDDLIPRIAQLISGLLEGFPLEGQSISLESVDNLYELFDRDQVFLIQDGMLHLSNNGQTLCSFDEGDLIGITNAFGMPYPVLRSDEFVELLPINRDRLLQHIYSDPKRMHLWSHFLICQNAIMANQLAEQTQALMRPASGFQHLQPGDEIICQGDSADHVYTLIDGGADVFVDGVKVGQIGIEEVFGAMAAFTGEPRSASVIANQPSTVMAVPKEDFVVLIEAQPKAAVNLIENLAKHITALNQQFVEKV